MNHDELYDDIDRSQSITEKYLGLTDGKFLIALCIVLFSGVYIGSLLYGTNSLMVLIKIDDYNDYLKGEIHTLKNQNAQKQREYFELKEISAQ